MGTGKGGGEDQDCVVKAPWRSHSSEWIDNEGRTRPTRHPFNMTQSEINTCLKCISETHDIFEIRTNIVRQKVREILNLILKFHNIEHGVSCIYNL